MRILLISNMYPSKEKAYAGIFVKNQYEELKKIIGDNDSVDIYYMKRQFTSKWGSVLKYFKAFLGFIPFCFKKYDVVHLHFFHPLIYLVWMYKKIYPNAKVVVTFHGLDITQKVNEKNQTHFQKLAKCVDYTIPVGLTLAEMVKNKLKLPVGSVLPVGVNNNIFFKEEEVKKDYDFIFIGSFVKRKGVDILINTIKALNRKDISFCFCGSGEYFSKLTTLQEEYNIIIKQNQTQTELRRLLNQSSFFVLMSRNEGFPTATIEAMYCGIPVITSDIPQFQEQVDEGVNGFTVPLEDVEALKGKMEYLINISETEYKKLCEGAQNSFKEISLYNVCQKLVTIYYKLAS